MSQSDARRATRVAASTLIRGSARFLLLCGCGVLLAACSEPFIVMSGDALSGEVMDPPADWSALAHVQVVQLETRPAEPYSVNIWMVAVGPDIYIATGEDGTNWTGFIEDDPDVRLRIEDKVYELEASRVIDQQERDRVAAAYVAKYDLDADDNWVMTGQVFRLDRR